MGRETGTLPRPALAAGQLALAPTPNLNPSARRASLYSIQLLACRTLTRAYREDPAAL
jgi:hypothetical protein